MSREAFEAIMAGVEDAGDYLRGNEKGRRVYTIDVGRIDVAMLRKDLELTQEQFAKVFRVKAGTIRNWEQGIREPAGPARVLLAVIARRPDAVLGALTEGPSKYAISKKRPKRNKKRGRPKKVTQARRATAAADDA